MPSSSNPVAAFAITLVLAACASPPPKIALSEQAAANLDDLTLIRPPQETGLTVMTIGHAAGMFGLVGGAIAASDQQDKSARFTELMKAQKFSASEALVSTLAQQLTAAGYRVDVQDGPWQREGDRYVLQKDKLPRDRPILVVTPRIVGYVANTAFSDYQPTMWVITTLLGKDQIELYRGFHSTGWKSMTGGERWKYTPGKASFANFEALTQKPDQAAAALNASAQLISASIADDLRRDAALRRQ